MEPAELKEWRKRLGLTQAGAASHIGISLRAYVTYEHGDRPVPRQTVLACRAIEAGLDGASRIGEAPSHATMDATALQRIVDCLEAGELGRDIEADIAKATGCSCYGASTSIDAAVFLHDRLLPGWCWRVATCCVSDDAWTMPDFNHPEHGESLKRQFPYKEAQQDPVEFFGTDVDLRPPGRQAAALLIATLRALIAAEERA